MVGVMIPKLSATTEISGQGIGRLSDALSCNVVHEVNGEYELKMKYPVTGLHYSELQNDRVLWADPDNFTEEQAFRIYRITRPLNNVVTVYARHIAYDMSGIVLNPFQASDLQTALMAIPGNCTPSCPFTFETTRSVTTPYRVKAPSVLWSMCGGTEGSLLDVYGGEWDFNNFTATLKTRLGTDRGFSVRYGRNLTQLEQDISIESTYKALYPFWYDEETGTLVKLDETYIEIPGAIGDRIQLVDFTGDFEEEPTKAQLRARAEAYIDRHKVGEPTVSWKIGFDLLAQSEEFKTVLEQVALGDAVTITYEPMDLVATSRVVKINYDVLMERYDSVTLGRVKQNLAAIVASTPQQIEKAVSSAKSALERAIDSSTDFIKHGTGYMRFIYNANGDLQEIVSLDDPDISQAKKVWRWNNGGFGYSSNGYNGTYGLAITQDGAIVADYITAGTMRANRVRAGLLIDEQNKNYWNLDTGELVIREGSINITTSSATSDRIVLDYTRNTAMIYPQGFEVRNKDENGDVMQKSLLQGTGLYFYDVGQTDVSRAYYGQWFWNLKDSNGTIRAHGGYNGITVYNSAGNVLSSYGENAIVGGTITGGGSGRNGGITLFNDADVRTVYFNGTSGGFDISNGTQSIAATAGGLFRMDNGSNKYTFLVWPDSNGAGRLVLGDGQSTKWRTELTNAWLVFRDPNDNQTMKLAAVPAETVLHASWVDPEGQLPSLVFSTDTIYVTSLGSFGYVQFELFINPGGGFSPGILYKIAELPAGQRPVRDMWQMIPDISGQTSCMIGMRANGDVCLYRWNTSLVWANSWIRAVIPYRFA